MASKLATFRPIIGVTGSENDICLTWWCLRLAVWCAGGQALRITPSIIQYGIPKLDGLIIGGGVDIDATLYNEVRLSTILPDIRLDSWWFNFRKLLLRLMVLLVFLFAPKPPPFNASGIDPARDELEYRLLRKAVASKLPVLGICRGAQLINIFFGGSLYQDIRRFYPKKRRIRSIFPCKEITLAPASRLARIMGNSNCRVNALHDQAIKNSGNGIVPVAMESNGIIQAIEHTCFPFMIGVQWHPEYLLLQHRQRSLFKKLVVHALNTLKDRA